MSSMLIGVCGFASTAAEALFPGSDLSSSCMGVSLPWFTLCGLLLLTIVDPGYLVGFTVSPFRM
jgi:hypothetical protein